MSRSPRPQPTVRSGRPAGRRATGATHALAGFVLGLLAVVAGITFAGTGQEQPLLSAAAEEAASVAAFRIAVGGDAAPEPLAVAVEPVEPQPFLQAGETLFNVRGATRVVVQSVGIDSEVRSVGYTFQGGLLRYDVPQLEAGQYVGTAPPGQPGNTVIGGHVATRGNTAVFQDLPGVKAGDIIEVYSGDRKFRYSVTEIKVVAADATSVMSQTHDATLTLITCFPGQDYSERLVVIGKLL
ncbi:MAG: sortase [Dehalococcoidia bacterium]|jgi:LPXTG-site transpeptidase (sortase) family protein|nr:sortase [Dehalococcoidia bacterium]